MGRAIANPVNLAEFCEVKAQLEALEWLETATWDDIKEPEEEQIVEHQSREY